MRIAIAFLINIKKNKTKIFNAWSWWAPAKFEIRYTINNKINVKMSHVGIEW